ncbi:adenylosuccinate synthetase, partial [uncultured Muribaculum sp.]
YKEYAKLIKPLVCDTGMLLDEYLQADKKVLFEGAQGAMLDIDYQPKLMNRLLVIISLLTAMTTLPMAASSVQEMNDDAITEVIDNSPTIKPVTGGLEITVSDGKAHEFYIYSITGQLVKRVKADYTLTVELPQGYYIVKCSSWSKKIVVR